VEEIEKVYFIFIFQNAIHVSYSFLTCIQLSELIIQENLMKFKTLYPLIYLPLRTSFYPR
jgi:hypothetical protein